MVQEKKIQSERNKIRAIVAPTSIEGVLTRQQNSQQCPFLIWDVSGSGLGLWSSERLKAGETVKLTVGQPFILMIECKVKWCEKKPSHEGFRCGLESTSKNRQLESLYQTFIEQNEAEKLAAS